MVEKCIPNVSFSRPFSRKTSIFRIPDFSNFLPVPCEFEKLGCKCIVNQYSRLLFVFKIIIIIISLTPIKKVITILTFPGALKTSGRPKNVCGDVLINASFQEQSKIIRTWNWSWSFQNGGRLSLLQPTLHRREQLLNQNCEVKF